MGAYNSAQRFSVVSFFFAPKKQHYRVLVIPHLILAIVYIIKAEQLTASQYTHIQLQDDYHAYRLMQIKNNTAAPPTQTMWFLCLSSRNVLWIHQNTHENYL